MDQSLKKLHRASAFAAYNGLTLKQARNGSSADSEKDKKKKRKRKRRSTPTAAALDAGNSANAIPLDDNEPVVVLDSADDDEEAPELVLVEKEPTDREKSKGKKRKSSLESAKDSSRISNEANPKRKRTTVPVQVAKKTPDSVARKLFFGGVSDTSSQQASRGVWKLLNTLTHTNSGNDARLAFAWLIEPLPMGEFFGRHWEQQPLCVQRDDRRYYDGLFSSEALDSILKRHDIQYTVNLDITKYEHGERETLNPTGRAYASVVWDFYKDGCSIRLLNPQTYCEAIWKLNSTLQEFFGTFVGANMYLTPANTQGFAPHYDDIEAFVLQLEGVKHWRVYKPKSDEETLPRFSSRNYKPDEVGEPIMEVDLRPGDMMYFPRGFIHEAVASKDEHSLHITISTTQRNTWGDFLQILVQQAVQTAMAENIEYRRALPLNYMDIAGAVHMDKKKKGRKDFLETAKDLLSGLVEYASIDGAADQMAKEKYIQDTLPPCLTEDEKGRCIYGQCETAAISSSGARVRLIKKHCLTLAMENEDISIYYNTENSRTYREKELQHFVIDPELAAGVDYLVEMYPRYVSVKDLPLENEADKVRICQLLYRKALLVTESA